MLVYTVCFTKKGQEPKDNKYIFMLLIWLKFVEVFGCIQTTDRICVIVDTKTKDYLESINILPSFYTCMEVE